MALRAFTRLLYRYDGCLDTISSIETVEGYLKEQQTVKTDGRQDMVWFIP